MKIETTVVALFSSLLLVGCGTSEVGTDAVNKQTNPEAVNPVAASAEELPAIDARARKAAKEGRFVEALALAETILSSRPDDQDAHMVAVIAACNSNNPSAAQKHLRALRSPGRRGMGETICKQKLGRAPEGSAEAASTCMDEVECLLTDSSPACCERHGKDAGVDVW